MQAYTDSECTFRHFENVIINGEQESIPCPFPPDWTFFAGVDLSSSIRPGNVIFVGAVDAEMIRRPVFVTRVKGSSPEVAQAIGQVYREFRPQVIVVEDNAYQSALIEWIQASGEQHPWWACIQPWTTTINKRHQQLGLPGMDVEFASGAWRLPASLRAGHELSCRCGVCQWVREMREHPMSPDTDCVMASWLFRNAVREWISVKTEELTSADNEFEFLSTPGRFF